MKTNDKPKFQPSKGGGAPGGQRNGNQRGQGKRKESFFQPVSKSESNAHSKDKGGGTGGRPYGKHGSGVHKTVAFKPKHAQRQGKEGKKPMNGNNSSNHGKGRPQHGKQKQQHQKHGNKHSPSSTKSPASSEIRFDSKPEKVNYCLAPERLEAQSRAIKQFEQKEREEEIERKKQDRQQKHKMMTQKTRKGQPVMQGRLELLYEKVKKVVGVQ